MRIKFQNQDPKHSIEYSYHSIESCMQEAYSRQNLLLDIENALAEIQVYFISREEMKKINLETRSIDKETDVLSFPFLEFKNGALQQELNESDYHPDFDFDDLELDETNEEESESLVGSVEEITDEENLVLDLGEILISIDVAQEQAKAHGHSLLRELCFLATHGTLHILGYDHEENTESEEQMFQLQEDILQSQGITRDIQDEEMGQSEEFRSGFVAILGRPNAGKSTLLNRLSGDDLAITSHKAQTTRNNIRTVLDDGKSQIIIVDTPGIHRSKNRLDRFMVDSAWMAMQDADLALLLVDPEKGRITEVEKVACQKAKELEIPLFLLISKTDAQSKESLLPVIARYSALYDFDEIIPISSVKDDNIALLLEKIKEYLPVGPRYYSPDAYTDQTERALASEYVREQLLHYTHQEVPHMAAVVIDTFDERMNQDGERTLVVIEGSIITDKDSHKGIIIGKGGQTLRRIGSSARLKLERLLDCKVYLDLRVKVRKDWQNKEAILKDLGYVRGQSGQSSDDVL